MSNIDSLPPPLRESIERIGYNSSLIDEWVHGDASAVVGTDGGPVKTIAKTVADAEEALTAVDGLRRFTDSFVSGNKTFVETPAAVFAGAAELSGRRWIAIRNESLDTRIRIGRLQANLQRDGEIIEPGAVLIVWVDSASALSIYGCSEGAAIIANIGEDIG